MGMCKVKEKLGVVHFWLLTIWLNANI